jgi:hypothetical protein
MKYPSSRPGIVFAAALAIISFQIENFDAQACETYKNIREFCSKRVTLSSIVTLPQVNRWFRIQTRSVRTIPDQARATISCDHDSDEDTKDQATMVLWHETIGTIGLAYSALLFNSRALMFSTVSLTDSSSRRSTSGTTPGTLVMLNACELQEDRIMGLIFNSNQMVPLFFFSEGKENPGTVGRGDSKLSAVSMQSGAAGGRRDKALNEGTNSDDATPSKLDPLDFSGVYEFDTEDEVCLRKFGFMKSDKQRTPAETLGAFELTERQKTTLPVKPWESRCPPRKGRLVVIAWEGGTPIFNLDHGTFISHHIVGPPWDGLPYLQSMTPNGDTTGPNSGMFKIIGSFNFKEKSFDFHVLKPNVGKTGRLLPVDGRPGIWATFEPFRAKKRLDIDCRVGIQQGRVCDQSNKDWDGYWTEAWNQKQKWLGLP